MNPRFINIVFFLITNLLVAQTDVLDDSTLKDLVIRQNPDLKAFAKRVETFKGKVLQASLRINPELDFESGTGGDSETIAQVNQTIELGRKRLKRTHVAELELEQVKLLYTIKKLEVLKAAKSDFIDILLAQQVVNLKKETVSIAEGFLHSVQTRVKAGRLSPAEEARAQIALSSLQIDLNRNQRKLKNRWRQLASFWGSKTSEFSWAEGDLNSINILPPEELLNQYLDMSPIFEEKKTAIQIQKGIIEVDRANRTPNLTISAGIKKTDVPNNTYQAGFSIPLQVFNRNQGTIQANTAQLDQVLEEKWALENRLRAEISSAYTDLLIFTEEIEMLKSSILPEAQKAYQIINDGYLQGKFDFLDVVDTQTTLYEAEVNLWLALSDFQKATTSIEMLLGQSIKSIIESSKEHTREK